MLTSAILVAAYSTLAAAIPTSNKVISRAGGPSIIDIPSNCTITGVLPCLESGQGALPIESTIDALFYSAFYPSPSDNITALAEQCLKQCYGYGDHTECKTMYWAENVVTEYGDLNTACLFYNRTLTEEDFVIAPEGEGSTPFAAGIEC